MTLRQAAEAITSVTDRAPKTIVGFLAVGLDILASRSSPPKTSQVKP